uniref:Polyprotein n=1 Tax=Macrostomum lignano TaxID=282301 RepID=A0A1I8FFJ6_9PLAT
THLLVMELWGETVTWPTVGRLLRDTISCGQPCTTLAARGPLACGVSFPGNMLGSRNPAGRNLGRTKVVYGAGDEFNWRPSSRTSLAEWVSETTQGGGTGVQIATCLNAWRRLLDYGPMYSGLWLATTAQMALFLHQLATAIRK